MNIFIRNERTGSTTLYELLKIHPDMLIFGHFALKHIASLWSSHPKDCLTGAITCPTFEDCFSFTFVRNPWTRIFSQFCFDDTVEDYSSKTFNKWVLLKPDSWWIRYSQHRYTHIDGEQAISQVYRYEDFQNEVYRLFDRLRLPCTSCSHKKRENQTYNKPESYADFYPDEARELVAYKWEPDIRLFDYRFEDINEKS
jgi:hypothetical protein